MRRLTPYISRTAITLRLTDREAGHICCSGRLCGRQENRLATVTLRTKESMAVVRTYKEVLSLSTMFYPDEVRSVQDLPDLPKGLEVREKELVMAKELILNLSTSFEPEKYKDSYRNKLLDVIQAKVEGKEIAVAPSPERKKWSIYWKHCRPV